jgi:hypothetical protein
MASCHSSQRTRIFRVSPEQIAGNGSGVAIRVWTVGNPETVLGLLCSGRALRKPEDLSQIGPGALRADSGTEWRVASDSYYDHQ